MEAQDSEYSYRTRPRTKADLVRFYYEEYRPLNALMQSMNEPPVQMSFEVSAAFDHLTRIERFGDSEEDAISSASSHLKRACFDGYKLLVKNARDEYDELSTITAVPS